MKELFVEHKFRDEALGLIAKANSILEEYAEQDLVLTLRQLYYQFVARGFLANSQRNYKRLGDIINDARLAGLVDWGMLEDRTRFLRKHSAWDGPAEILKQCAAQYREDVWRDQECRPEVWIEKDALVGVIEAACRHYRVPYLACRGYASQSLQYETGLRFRQMLKNGRRPVILHLGDHDPSGIDMTRDNADRLSLFSGEEIEVHRLALNIEQVRKYNPPPNPAKESDSRSGPYIEKFGDESWELDALNPSMIDSLIRDSIDELIDGPAWKEALRQEKQNREKLQIIADNWTE